MSKVVAIRQGTEGGQFQQRQTKRKKVEMPMVMKKKQVILFVSESTLKIEKQLQKFADPLSKPAHVHEFLITTESLCRASSLGMKASDVKSFLQSHLYNDIPVECLHQIDHSMPSQAQPELYLQEGSQNYFIFECDQLFWNKNHHDLTKYISTQLPEQEYLQMKDEDEEKKSLEGQQSKKKRYIVQRNKHGQLAQQLFNRYSLFIKAQREIKDAVHQEKIFTGGNIEHNFEKHPLHCKPINISLKAFTKLRHYQSQALKQVIKATKTKKTAKNGYIVLPCGAGKTLLGISILTQIKRQALVVCSSDSGADQWKRQIEKWTQGFPREQIIILTAQSQFSFQRDKKKRIFISTYSSLKSKLVVKDIKSQNKWLKYMPWGLIIFDECQTLPAQENRQILHYLMGHVKIGLTATPMREDDQIKALNYMIGPRLYSGDWKTFVEDGYLANPKCIQIRTTMTQYFSTLYKTFEKEKSKRQTCYQVNPNKVKALLYLLEYHEKLQDNIIVFCDNIKLIKFLADSLHRAMLIGQTNVEERNFIFDMFRQGKIKTVFLSRIGDQAIDLPNANVAIEVNIQQGSRKQMLQRLGRIMRQKQASSSNSYNALFYTIISDDTDEKRHFFKRYNCLIDEGFHYDVRFFQYSHRKEGIEDILKIQPQAYRIISEKYNRIIRNEEEYWKHFESKNENPKNQPKKHQW